MAGLLVWAFCRRGSRSEPEEEMTVVAGQRGPPPLTAPIVDFYKPPPPSTVLARHESEEVRFALDSPPEERRFEPSVPQGGQDKPRECQTLRKGIGVE